MPRQMFAGREFPEFLAPPSQPDRRARGRLESRSQHVNVVVVVLDVEDFCHEPAFRSPGANLKLRGLRVDTGDDRVTGIK